MAIIIYSIVLAISAFLLAAAGSWLLVKVLPMFHILDIPNARSNHQAPVPRGGGLAVIGTALFFMLVSGVTLPIFVAVVSVAVISFLDDRSHIPARYRLMIQALAAILVALTIENPVFQGHLPEMLDKALAAAILVWAMNLFNFMDGIDEMSVGQSVSLALGLLAMVWIKHDLPKFLILDSLILAGAMLGFWLWNRHPARLFLGDVGSVPAGLILGYLLLILASQGFWQAAVILPAYYLFDGSVTLLSRLIRGKRIWEAHSEHAYQRAVRGGLSHRQVVTCLVMVNLLLIALAATSTLGHYSGYAAILAAYGAAGIVSSVFRWRGRIAAEPLPV